MSRWPLDSASHHYGLRRSPYDPNQPRMPAGNPDGGQWTSWGGRSDPRIISDAAPDNAWQPGARYAARRPGSVPVRIGGRTFEATPEQAARLAGVQARAQGAIARVRELDPSWRPRPSAHQEETVEGFIRAYEGEAREAEARLIELAQRIARERPATSAERTRALKEAAKWLLDHPELVIDASSWLYGHLPTIESYRDPPKTLEELQRGASTPKRGYDIHHIVEQTLAEKDGFPRSMIDAPENLVRIPTLKHREINGWYGRPNEKYGGLSPREYLRGRNWNERFSVGREALIEHGVLKP